VAFQRYVRAHLGVHGVFAPPALVLGPPRVHHGRSSGGLRRVWGTVAFSSSNLRCRCHRRRVRLTKPNGDWRRTSELHAQKSVAGRFSWPSTGLVQQLKHAILRLHHVLRLKEACLQCLVARFGTTAGIAFPYGNRLKPKGVPSAAQALAAPPLVLHTYSSWLCHASVEKLPGPKQCLVSRNAEQKKSLAPTSRREILQTETELPNLNSILGFRLACLGLRQTR
jgi:hypothetical protein